MARREWMESKANVQLDSSRFHPTCIFSAYLLYGLHPGVLVWATRHSQDQDLLYLITVRTHTTKMVHANPTLQVWTCLEAATRFLRKHQITDHNQQS